MTHNRDEKVQLEITKEQLVRLRSHLGRIKGGSLWGVFLASYDLMSQLGLPYKSSSFDGISEKQAMDLCFLEPVQEMTIEEISKALGKTIKVIGSK